MQKKLIYSLIILSVFLLLINILLEVFNKNFAQPDNKTESVSSIEKKFLNVLKSFAIKEEWIKKLSESNNHKQTINYKILIPNSIKTPILLSELVSSLENSSIKIVSNEKSINGNFDLKIYDNSQVKLIAKFYYNNNIERDIARLSLIVLCEDLSNQEIEEIITSLPVYHLLIPLNDNAVKITAFAKSFNLEYSLLIDDEISSEYEIDESENKKIIIAQINKIISSFPDASAFIIDQNSSIYMSKILPLIQKEFNTKGKLLIQKNKFHSLVGKSYNEQISLLQYYCSTNTETAAQNIIISGGEIFSLQNEIYNLQLRGNQFVKPIF